MMYRQIIDDLPGLKFGSRLVIQHDDTRSKDMAMSHALSNVARAMAEEVMKDRRFFSFQEIRYGGVFSEVRVDAIVLTAEELRNIMMDYYKKGMDARPHGFGYMASPL